jgi:capsular polysaccharide biosynthesis protein
VFTNVIWHVSGDWWKGMVGNGPFIARNRSGGMDRALVSFPTPNPCRHLYGKYTLIGSQRNWGHWIHDHLGIIAAARALPDAHERNMVFGMLTDKQRECLRLADVRDDEIVELQCGVGTGTATWFEDLAVPSGISFRARADNVRTWARKAADLGCSRPKVYVSRTDGRVANKESVDALFRVSGYDVIEDIALRPIREQLRIFTQAEHLAMSYGADAVAAAMCGLDTHVVTLTPTFRSNLYDTSMDFGPKARMVYGSEVYRLEEPCTFDLDAIAHAIDSR